MIVKRRDNTGEPSGKKQKAGADAEDQMAHYLNRAFANDTSLYVLNDLRLIDKQQPEHDGRPGVAQIDHLILHKHGAFIIESKSVTDEVSVRDDGSGGDEWTRRYKGHDHGFPSPIQQARRQGEFLREFLQNHKSQLLGTMPVGLRTLSKLLHGTDQRGFGFLPIHIVVAISDQGKINRRAKWTEPSSPFKSYVCKADLVPDKINDELNRHKVAARKLGDSTTKYGTWSMKKEEVGIVAEFLNVNHQPAAKPATTQDGDTPTTVSTAHSHERYTPTGAPTNPTQAAPAHTDNSSQTTSTPEQSRCAACDSTDLIGMWGRYGYYWTCCACKERTSMPATCSFCGTTGFRGKHVRIRKEGPKFFACEKCGIDELIWTNPRTIN